MTTGLGGLSSYNSSFKSPPFATWLNFCALYICKLARYFPLSGSFQCQFNFISSKISNSLASFALILFDHKKRAIASCSSANTVQEKMESAGGFHSYRQLPNTTSSGLKLTERHNNNHISSTDENECTVREQDQFMPIANVIRIMRKILPSHAKISDDAKETIQECVSEYISFITGEANERCQREQRKTITAEDVLWAMSKLGFDDYIEPLTIYLHRYREMEGEPLVKRSVEYKTLGAAAGAFHMGYHHHQRFYRGGGGAGMGGYLKDANGNSNGNGIGSSSSSSQGSVANNG